MTEALNENDELIRFDLETTDGKTVEVECSREVVEALRQQLREQLLYS